MIANGHETIRGLNQDLSFHLVMFHCSCFRGPMRMRFARIGGATALLVALGFGLYGWLRPRIHIAEESDRIRTDSGASIGERESQLNSLLSKCRTSEEEGMVYADLVRLLNHTGGFQGYQASAVKYCEKAAEHPLSPENEIVVYGDWGISLIGPSLTGAVIRKVVGEHQFDAAFVASRRSGAEKLLKAIRAFEKINESTTFSEAQLFSFMSMDSSAHGSDPRVLHRPEKQERERQKGMARYRAFMDAGLPTQLIKRMLATYYVLTPADLNELDKLAAAEWLTSATRTELRKLCEHPDRSLKF